MAVCADSNDSLVPAHLSSNKFYKNLELYCVLCRPGSIISIMFSITNIFLLLPLSILVLCHRLQEWWQKRSTSSAAMMSHSDSFTYHLVIMEQIGVLGCILSLCGIYGQDQTILLVGNFLYCLTWYGQNFFHILTCVERYLAVVHPVPYLRLREERWIRNRNICIGCVWLICVAGASVTLMDVIIVEFCLLISSLTLISFCSISVLCVLIRPSPGKQRGNRMSIDQSKLRAFYTIVLILGVLLLRFAWVLIWAVMHVIYKVTNCVIVTCNEWFNLPSGLVLPLLFLHRAGKLRS